jgi:hypothetical protein
VWFDPGVGQVLPGEVLEFHRAAQVLTVQALIGGKVSTVLEFVHFFSRQIHFHDFCCTDVSVMIRPKSFLGLSLNFNTLHTV